MFATRLTVMLIVAVVVCAAPDLIPGGSWPVLLFDVPGAEANPAERRRVGRKKPKKSRKERAIERHLYTAQYFLLRENDPKAAAGEYRKVLKLDRGHVEASLALAGIQVRRNQAKKAIVLLKKLAKKRPGEGRIWHALGRASTALGDHRTALASYKKALRSDRFDVEAHWLIFDQL
ncbi:MAG: tetratricopeptide repeat protein, partial [Proteobacteria bacterium]|nr:tetratricopeptide repeat protein [Pseudomonadota bacterium]